MTAKAQQIVIPPDSGCNSESSWCQTTAVFSSSSEQCVSVSVSSVKYHNKAVVQRTELYTKKKKQTGKKLKQYTPELQVFNTI